MQFNLKYFTFLLFCCFPVLFCSAQTSVWKIKSNGNELFIGGTVHILRPQDFPLPRPYDNIYNLVKYVVLEADMGLMEKPEFAQKIMTKGMYSDSLTLKSVLNTFAYEKLKKSCSAYSLPIENLNKLKPSLIILTLVGLKLNQMGMTQTGTDAYFYKKAQADTKELFFLESAEEQLDLICNMGEGYESEFVLKSLEDLEKQDQLLIDMILAIKKGKSDIFISENDSMKMEFPGLYESLLVKRNKNWIPIIETYLKSPEHEFILFGALHLHGKDGILELLKQKGYSIEQL